jgi:hypothetical protein
MRLVIWALPITAALAYGTWHLYAAQVYVGDLPPFDLHFYGFEDGRAYLAGLSPAAKATYLGPLHQADTVLLLALAATLMLAVWRRGWLWCLPALAYAGFDLLENWAVSGLLVRGIREPGEIYTVAVLTGCKFLALGLAVILALWRLWRLRRAAG